MSSQSRNLMVSAIVAERPRMERSRRKCSRSRTQTTSQQIYS